MDLESPQREVVVSGHKYHMRPLCVRNGTDDIEPRLSRHLNVQEHQIRPMPVNRLHRFSPVAALAHKFQILASLRECSQAASRKFFIIGNYGANLHAGAASMALSLSRGSLRAASRKGSVMTTAHPVPSVRLPIFRLAAAPYNAFSRSEEFCRPMPKAHNVPSLSPGPSSSTDTMRSAPSLRTDTHR